MTEKKVQPEQAEEQRFVPPDVKVGQDVVYYPMAVRNSRVPSIGKVMHNNGNVVVLFEVTPTGGTMIRESVRHIDDPKLALNQTQRENGAWDHTESTKAELARYADMDEHLRAMEGCLLGPTKSDRELLLYYGKRFWIPEYQKVKSDDLRIAVLRCLQGKSHGLDAEKAE